MTKKAFYSLALLGAFVGGLLAYHPLARAVETFAYTTCSSAQACAGGVNKANGPAVIAYSTGGTGLVAQTQNTKAAGASAVLGKDLATTTSYNDGVFGTSTRGMGVYGKSSGGIGVTGTLAGPLSTGTKFTPAAMEGLDNTGTGSFALIGISQRGDGVYGQSNSSSNKLAALNAYAPNGAYIFYGSAQSGSAVAMDNQGNIFTTGLVYTNGSCSAGCDARHRVRSAAVTAAAPTIEDSGEAQLVRGAVYVSLDPRFADAVDMHQRYLVFLTPEGDTAGLYVSARTPAGFTVREIGNGHSSLAFAYRIVAHPYGTTYARLPYVEIPAQARVAHQ
ncbi:MAG TPA: hypothetical protein VMH02_00015 [Verrucomicrobiae bacterium]|nr:hypothetical protein [Verrucomicrobiae bacterium]